MEYSHRECKKLAVEIVEKTFDSLVENALRNDSDFAYEGQFTNDATWDIPKKFKDAGYQIHLVFFGLSDVTLSEIRVIGRAKEGGHYVDPITIAANFYGNLEKLDKYYTIFDSLTIVDTSSIEHIGLVVFAFGKEFSTIASNKLPNWFTQNLPRISSIIMQKESGKNN